MSDKYPKENDIKVKWKTSILIITVVTFNVILFLIGESRLKPISLTKWLSVGGLYFDFIGVIIASLRTPYYGSFHDGGEIEKVRQKVENKYFRLGIYLIAIGFLLQVVTSLFPERLSLIHF